MWILARFCAAKASAFDVVAQARAMMLAGMDSRRRRQLLKAMKHEQTAAMLVSMNAAGRKSLLEDLDANGAMHETLDMIR